MAFVATEHCVHSSLPSTCGMASLWLSETWSMRQASESHLNVPSIRNRALHATDACVVTLTARLK